MYRKPQKNATRTLCMSAPRTASAIPVPCPGLDLLLTCARWPQDATDRELIRQHSAKPLDWQLFLQLAQHHRLAPLVWHNLRVAVDTPTNPAQESAFEQLQQLASANTLQSLRSLAELRRIAQKFQSHRIPLRVLKGLPLAQSVYGDLSLRAAGDLDLLIDEPSILEADRLLRSFGYRGLFPLHRLTPKRLAFYRAHWKDLAYRNPTTGFEIDLHWRCFRNPDMPGASLIAASAAQAVSFGSLQVTTMPPMENLLYLCVHGTLDGWLYLKSLADVAAQVRPMDAAQLKTLATLAAHHGILPELTAALILAHRYFNANCLGFPLLPEDHPIVAHILRFTHRSLEQNAFLAGRDSIPARATLAFEIGLRPTLHYRRELVLRVLFRARMWQTLPLPDRLFPLYPLLSPVEWLAFRLRRWLAKPSAVTLKSEAAPF